MGAAVGPLLPVVVSVLTRHGIPIESKEPNLWIGGEGYTEQYDWVEIVTAVERAAVEHGYGPGYQIQSGGGHDAAVWDDGAGGAVYLMVGENVVVARTTLR